MSFPNELKLCMDEQFPYYMKVPLTTPIVLYQQAYDSVYVSNTI